jgi:membrane fusion protein (multidrug efflux system)
VNIPLFPINSAHLRQSLVLFALVSGAFLFTACGGGGEDQASAGKSQSQNADSAGKDGNQDGKKKEKAAEPVPVQVVQVTRGPIASTLSFNSTLETEATVDLYPQVTGQVDELFVEEGDIVKTGDPLIRIDDRQWRVDADEARVTLAQQENEFARTESLFQRKLVNEQDYESAKFSLEQMRLRHERARIQLDYATVRAPFDGVVSEREVQVGARVGPNTKLFSLVSLQDMVARVYVPGRYLPDVAAGQEATLTSDFLPGREFAAWVKRISPVIDPSSGTFKVTVGVRAPDGDIVPGLFVRASIITEERPAALLVPKRAIVYDGGDQYIFTVREGAASRLPFDAGFETADTIELRSGLTEGDAVIILGQTGLKDGAPVKVVNPDLLPPEAASPLEPAPEDETATADDSTDGEDDTTAASS